VHLKSIPDQIACGLYYKKHGVLKPVTDSPKKPARRRKARAASVATSTNTPTHTPLPVEPMSEIDHPLLSEGICLPRMGYLRGGGGDSLDSGDEDEETSGVDKENIDPDDEEMERFFSDILV
jgi:hypothetical protein